MTGLAWLLVAIVVLFFVLVVVVILTVWDWRAWLVRKYGPNYKHGLAHIEVNGVWLYRESELVHDSDIAATYLRKVKHDGADVFVGDIVPKRDAAGNEIHYGYDEYSGRLTYRVRPGAVVACSDDGDAPATDFPSELLSPYLLDRNSTNFASSVNSEKTAPWGTIAVIAVIVIVLIVGLFATGVLKMPKNGAAPTANVTAPAPATAPAATPVSGPVGGK
jgi:hypothetical protein